MREAAQEGPTAAEGTDGQAAANAPGQAPDGRIPWPESWLTKALAAGWIAEQAGGPGTGLMVEGGGH